MAPSTRLLCSPSSFALSFSVVSCSPVPTCRSFLLAWVTGSHLLWSTTRTCMLDCTAIDGVTGFESTLINLFPVVLRCLSLTAATPSTLRASQSCRSTVITVFLPLPFVAAIRTGIPVNVSEAAVHMCDVSWKTGGASTGVIYRQFHFSAIPVNTEVSCFTSPCPEGVRSALVTTSRRVPLGSLGSRNQLPKMC